MKESAKLFDRIVEEHKAHPAEAIIDFTVNGVEFSLSLVNGVMVLWYDDEGQDECLFSDAPQHREGIIEWLEYAIAQAIQ